MATTTPSYGEENLSDAWTCQSQCQSQQSCNFVQWNHSTRMCQFFQGEIEEIYKDKESLLAAGDCKNIALLWKKKPMIATTTAGTATTTKKTTTSTTKTTTSTTTTTATTTERMTMKPTSTSEAYRQENEERWPEQHSTSTG
jgi:hypothetical protein